MHVVVDRHKNITSVSPSAKNANHSIAVTRCALSTEAAIEQPIAAATIAVATAMT
jgi:hypothetical protein